MKLEHELFHDTETESANDSGGDWRVETLADADFALERIAEAEREKAENEKLHQAALERLNLRHLALQSRLDRTIAYFGSRLRAFAEANRETLLTGKRKSRALLHGSIGWRKRPERFVVADSAALLEWAKREQERLGRGLVKVTEAPDVAEIRAYYKHFGEVPPGCDVEPEQDEFNIKTEKGE